MSAGKRKTPENPRGLSGAASVSRIAFDCVRLPAWRIARTAANALQLGTAFLAVRPASKLIAAALRTDFRPSGFNALIAQRSLERRAEKAGFLYLCVQMRDDFAFIVVDRGAAFRARLPFVGVVPTAYRTLHGKLYFRLFMAPVAPRRACSAIRHGSSPLIPDRTPSPRFDAFLRLGSRGLRSTGSFRGTVEALRLQRDLRRCSRSSSAGSLVRCLL